MITLDRGKNTMSEKQYNNLTDIEKDALREYESWKKSDAPLEYKLAMLENCYKILVKLEIISFLD